MKKFLLFLGIAMFIFSTASLSHASAKSNDVGAKATLDKKTQVQLENTLEKYEVEMINPTDLPADQLVEFDSVEQFEEFVKELQHIEVQHEIQLSNSSKPSLKFNDPDLFNSAAVTYYSGHEDYTWYSPYNAWGTGSIAQFKNISFDYQYYYSSNKPRFHSVSNITSAIYGVTLWGWSQSSSNSSFSSTNHTNDTTVVTVKGVYTLLGSLNGFNFGATIPGTWTHTWVLK